MPLTMAEGLSQSILDALRQGGDGRNAVAWSENFANAVWNDDRGSGSIDTTKAAGWKPGTKRGVKVTDLGGFSIYQTIGDAGDYAGETVTASAWVRPIANCSELKVELRNTARTQTGYALHPTPGVSKWRHLAVTVPFESISDTIEIAFLNDDVNSPGAIFEVQWPQVEIGSKATAYQMTKAAGSAPLQTILDAIESSYGDGLLTPAPEVWELGTFGSIGAVPSWPFGYVIVEDGELDTIAVAPSAGSTIGSYRVTIGVGAKGEPASPGTLRRKLHRYLRGILERIIDAEAGNELGAATMGAGPVILDFRSGIATESEMFADASLTFTFGIQETR